MKKIIYLIILLIILVIGWNFYISQNEVLDFSQSCEEGGGNWLGDFKECEYTSQAWCDEKGGEFSECESACRNNPEAEICTLQCVPVCDFQNLGTK